MKDGEIEFLKKRLEELKVCSGILSEEIMKVKLWRTILDGLLPKLERGEISFDEFEGCLADLSKKINNSERVLKEIKGI